MSDRDPIGEQDDAARRYEEHTGRKSTDPVSAATMRVRTGPNGEMIVETSHGDLDRPGRIDHFARRGIKRTVNPELGAPPDAVFLRAPAGTDPRAALGAVFNEMFPPGTSQEEEDAILEAQDAARDDVIEVDGREMDK